MVKNFIEFVNFKSWRGISCILLVLMVLVSLSSCHNSESEPDVSKIKVKLDTHRFDKDLAAIDTNTIPQGLIELKKEYPEFLDFWLDQLMQFGVKGNYVNDNPGVSQQLRQFLTYKDFRGLFDTVAAHFPNTKIIDEPLAKGFQYWKYYYPQHSVPKIIYFVSGLNNWSAVTLDTDIVAIGLDMYLGSDYPFYKSVLIPEYMLPSLRPEVAPVNVFKAIYEAQHPFQPENLNLLQMMIERGKEQYFLSKILPFVASETRLGFTKNQLDWCNKNEGMIYNFFVKGGFLYEKNWTRILRYVNDGPEATGMPKESPGNVGTWLGWQIVKAYVAEHPNLKLDEVFALKDAQAVLQEGHYKPR
ncbi:MAG: hypothetical protein ABI378_13725 [Chitinophagaceae bacterium]